MASLKAVRAEVEQGLAPLRLELKDLCESMASRMENLEGQMHHLAHSLNHRLEAVEQEVRGHFGSPCKGAALGFAPGALAMRSQSRGNGLNAEMSPMQPHSPARILTASPYTPNPLSVPLQSSKEVLPPGLAPDSQCGQLEDGLGPGSARVPQVASPRVLECVGSFPGPGTVQRLASGSAGASPTSGAGTPLLARGQSAGGAIGAVSRSQVSSRAGSTAASARRRAPRTPEVLGRGGKKAATASGRGMGVTATVRPP